MRKFWKKIGEGLLKGASWALDHPVEILRVIEALKRK